MTETTRALLLRSLRDRYDELKARLTRRLGSADLASDALHETWLRLERRDDLAAVKNPNAYIYRAALNTASNLRKADTRRLTQLDTDGIMAIVDDAPGPAMIAEDREEVAAFLAALAELTERQHIDFRESFLGDTSRHQLAQRFGVTIRTIQIDLQRAVEHCARRLGKKYSFVSGRGRLSGKGE
jgi:RNA polymerase sigma factor (sigma-70 family)